MQDLTTKATDAVGVIAGLVCKSILSKGDPKPLVLLLSLSWDDQDDDGWGHFVHVSLQQACEEAQPESRARAWGCLISKATCQDQHEAQAGMLSSATAPVSSHATNDQFIVEKTVCCSHEPIARLHPKGGSVSAWVGQGLGVPGSP